MEVKESKVKAHACGKFATNTKIQIMFDAFTIAKAGEDDKRKRRVCLCAITNNLVFALRRIERYRARPSEVLANDGVMKIDIHEFYTAVTTRSNNEIVIQLDVQIGTAT